MKFFSRICFVCVSAALYWGLACLFFLPSLGGSQKLLGTSQWAPDNILDAGILEWGYRALASHRSVFAWVAGYPLRESLAGTESLLGWQVFYTPFRLAGFGTVT